MQKKLKMGERQKLYSVNYPNITAKIIKITGKKYAVISETMKPELGDAVYSVKN